MARNESTSRRMIDTSLLGRRTMLERSVGALAGTIIGAVSVRAGGARDGVAQPSASQPAAQGFAPTQGIRRIVTGNNARGKSYVVSDVRTEGGRHPNVFHTTSEHPLGSGGSGDLEAILPSSGYPYSLDPPPGACSSTYVYLPPANPNVKPVWHRTMTIDYAFLISGELVCMLEEEEVVLRNPGDVVVQRNTNHAWRSNSTVNPCIFVGVLVSLVGRA